MEEDKSSSGSRCTHTNIRQELPSTFSRILNKELSTIRTDIQELRKSVDFISEALHDLKLTIDLRLR